MERGLEGGMAVVSGPGTRLWGAAALLSVPRATPDIFSPPRRLADLDEPTEAAVRLISNTTSFADAYALAVDGGLLAQ